MTDTSSDSQILSAIMNAAVDAIIVSDAAGGILRANPAAHKLFDYDVGDLLGLNVRTLMPRPKARQHDRFMTDYIETGVEKVIGIGREVEGQRKDGEAFPLHLSVGEAKVGDAPVFVAILHDLTRRVASENALARTMRLDAIGQMTGGISHDFNNLLTVIIGNLELAEMRAKDDKTAKYLKNAMDAAEMGSGLTSRLMIFARKGPLKPEVSELGPICHNTIELLKPTLGATYEITSECPENLSPVLIDPVQLESALVNLAVNARDAMPDGGNLRFEVSEIEIDDDYMAQETDVEPGHYVRLLVSDDGEGMSPEMQKRAFEPFYTTKADLNGTGLGLAMVYGFVRQSGGHITLYSEVGHGTNFGLYFPALREAAEAELAVAKGNGKPDLPLGNGECVLVVEDNPKVRRISVDRLHALNYRTEEAEDADVAYQILQDGANIDIVFSDVVMPGTMTGFDLAARILSDFPQIKILLTTGYTSEVVAEDKRSSDQFEVLHKPYHQRDLARRLSALLGRS
jgi:PAS domain S-box-containing protein